MRLWKVISLGGTLRRPPKGGRTLDLTLITVIGYDQVMTTTMSTAEKMFPVSTIVSCETCGCEIEINLFRGYYADFNWCARCDADFFSLFTDQDDPQPWNY